MTNFRQTLLILFSLLGSVLQAQIPSENVEAFGRQLKSGPTTSWYSTAQLIEDYSGKPMSLTPIPLFQDSSVLVVNQSHQAVSNTWNLLGSVIQPIDPLFELQESLCPANRNFMIDSVRFAYEYFRPVDSVLIDGLMKEVIDTLFIHFLTNDQLDTSSRVPGSDKVYVTPHSADFNPTDIGPSDHTKIDTILLNSNLSTGNSYTASTSPHHHLSLKTRFGKDDGYIVKNSSETNDNILGYCAVFKTMLDYNAGDTLISFDTSVTPSKKLNSFCLYGLNDSENTYTKTGSVCNSFGTDKTLRDGDANDLFLSYRPLLSFAGLEKDIHLLSDFNVTCFSTIANPRHAPITVYPNPARPNQFIRISADERFNTATAFISDLNGAILTKVDEFDNNLLVLSTKTLNPGLYLLSIELDHWVSFKKILIME